jgi:hypothetical protein
VSTDVNKVTEFVIAGAVTFGTGEINARRHAILALPDVVKMTEYVMTEAVWSRNMARNVQLPVDQRHIITVRAGIVANLTDCVTPVNLVDGALHVDHYALTPDIVPLETVGRSMVTATDVCLVERT